MSPSWSIRHISAWFPIGFFGKPGSISVDLIVITKYYPILRKNQDLGNDAKIARVVLGPTWGTKKAPPKSGPTAEVVPDWESGVGVLASQSCISWTTEALR